MNRSFIQATNLRLDEPFIGLAAVPEAFREKVRDASLKAFDELVLYTLNEEPDFLLLTGEIWGGWKRSVRAGLALIQGIDVLAQKSIPVFILGHGEGEELPLNAHFVEGPVLEPIPGWSVDLKKTGTRIAKALHLPSMDRMTLQGRSYRNGEWGPKGAVKVGFEDGALTEITFKALDAVRLLVQEWDLSSYGDLPTALDGLEEEIGRLAAAHDGPDLVVRVCFNDWKAPSDGLCDRAARPGIVEELRSRFDGRDPFIWIEDVVPAATRPVPVDEVREREGLAAVVMDKAEYLAETGGDLERLLSDGDGDPLTARSVEDKLALLAEAEARLVERLGEGGGR